MAGLGQANARARFGDLGLAAAARLVRAAPVPALPEGRIVELPGRGRTYLVDTGPVNSASGAPAPTLVLLHALACTGLLTWYPSLELLRRRYRVVVFDQRGHGQGIRGMPFDLADCADDVAAVADLLDIERFVAVGYSMGTLVAQLTWRRRPERVAGLVLCAGATHFADTPRRQRTVHQVGARLAARAIAEREFVLDQTLDPRWSWRQFRATTAAEVGAAAAVLARFDSRPWIGEVVVPASVVVTTRDRLITPDRQRAMARALPDVTVYEAEAGHASCVLGAERFTPALSAAVASVASRLPAPR